LSVHLNELFDLKHTGFANSYDIFVSGFLIIHLKEFS